MIKGVMGGISLGTRGFREGACSWRGDHGEWEMGK